jgi:CDP-diacylglycerol--glycerol-3-phosphate 3-phosphatidyltransferase
MYNIDKNGIHIYMKKFLNVLKSFLEKVDYYKDEFLFVFIKPYWPRCITPNHITYIRVLIGVVLFILLFFLGTEDRFLIFSLFLIGVLTDFIDGPVARGTNRVTEFGAMLDSTADRIIILPIAVYSLFGMHKWLLLILLLTEILNAIIYIYCKSKSIYLESNIYGKTKMVLQSMVFVAILVAWPEQPSPIFIYILWLTIPIILLSFLSRIAEISPSKLTYFK